MMVPDKFMTLEGRRVDEARATVNATLGVQVKDGVDDGIRVGSSG
jgi:hypothetical protein